MAATQQTTTFTAPDISCAHCVQRVQTAVAAVPGVENVTANAETKRVEVTFDAGQTSPRAISAAMADAGYPVAR